MKEDFNQYLYSICPCSAKKRFLLAVSGGIDSVVMARLFYISRFKFAIVHCNFQLRGAESDSDQLFVEKLAEEYGVCCYTIRFDTALYAEKQGISIQMAARDLRYNWFREVLLSEGYDYVAVAHNKNDVVETMLLNLIRGTGIRGLMGIRAINNQVIRPMLFATRQQIAGFAKHEDISWREDSSNAETKYHRNKIRHTIIPAMENINPAFIENALDTIRRMEQTGVLLDYGLDKIKTEVWTELSDRILLNIEKLKVYPAVDIILFELLRNYGIAQLDVDKILNTFNSDPGKQFRSHTHTFTRDRIYLMITKNEESPDCEIQVKEDTLFIEQPILLKFSSMEAGNNFEIPRQAHIAVLDADKVNYPLTLRKWKNGDRFHPLGLNGSKKISDFLIDIKTPLPDKKHIWVLESAGQIMWIVNHRIDDRFSVTDETRKILLIEYRKRQ
jgi:tRNA(Ile)-lysidine synthase